MIDRKAKPIAPSGADPVELDDSGASPVDTAGSRREHDPDEPRQMINEEMLLRLVPIGRATLYRMMRDGTFPKGTFVSPNRRLWLSSEIARWQREVDAFVPNRRRGKGRGRRASGSSD
ncbi:AlpA family phage regulatory protein [Bradyrhizobium sp. UNPA324]|uniref:helix-turn-helix transcriptional regulator n=1 Tax=Bradyrhizobium sp. UNPA324 TaxID=1141174 RepID=UPI001153963E|nr:AlpA family phage regulatory protein [Bradyrhizobium sp. UNPA324]TQF29165.1 hypothetical protein UNPA324_05555 [Bradyrhizobium sp. UNPA324]TQF31851.1 hypothetical protein UNPA324_21175 [Bradyrhizobium sp. UNPA324]